jgi:hypothetical protein
MRRPRFAVSLLLLLLACHAEPPTSPWSVSPSAAIIDGNNGGNEHFFFLPPLAASAPYEGDLDASLAPLVRIILDNGVVVELDAALSLPDEHYGAVWHTGLYGLEPGSTGVVSVSVMGQELGTADIVLVASGKQRKSWDPEDRVPVKLGSALPIRFRIEIGALSATLPVRVEVSPDGAVVEGIGSQFQMHATAYDDTGAAIPGATFTWESLNPVIATVDPQGVLTGRASGQVTVRATSGGIVGFGLVNVNAPFPDMIRSWEVVGVPTVENLARSWGSSSTDIWVVGDEGSILHYDGLDWKKASSPVSHPLWDVWGFSPDNIWAVGGYSILHFDGVEWTVVRETDFPITALWGSSPNDVWVGHNNATFLRFDGTRWESIDSPVACHVANLWGASPKDIWAACYGGILIRFDGISWAEQTWPSDQALGGLWGFGPSSLWMGDFAGALCMYDGVAWTPYFDTTFHSVLDIWGSGTSDVWSLHWGPTLLRFDGSQWHPIALPDIVGGPGYGPGQEFISLWGDETGTIWLFGYGGTVLRGAPME